MRREFLQLAKKYDPVKMDVSGWLVSEKLDGTRCFWDGGITRGMRTEQVPWANVIDPKTGERKKKIKEFSTGLWSRYGNPIIAPDEFLNGLPCMFLDGELWAGRGNFQLCRSICAGDEPDERFLTNISFAVYGSPPPEKIFSTGDIKNSNFHNQIREDCLLWAKLRAENVYGSDFKFLPKSATFVEEINTLTGALESHTDFAHLHKQKFVESRTDVEKFMESVLDLGGEGVVLRDPSSIWSPKRVSSLLKYKPFFDAEAIVVGFTSGRETDKGSKHRGKIGALITEYGGKRLELAGLTDEERLFENETMSEYAWEHPGEDMPKKCGDMMFQGSTFKVGQKVTFKYRELSDDGIPKEARYWR